MSPHDQAPISAADIEAQTLRSGAPYVGSTKLTHRHNGRHKDTSTGIHIKGAGMCTYTLEQYLEKFGH